MLYIVFFCLDYVFKVDRIKIENLILILEVVLVDFDFDCWIFVFGGICDLFLYFWCVFNGIVLLFYVLKKVLKI